MLIPKYQHVLQPTKPEYTTLSMMRSVRALSLKGKGGVVTLLSGRLCRKVAMGNHGEENILSSPVLTGLQAKTRTGVALKLAGLTRGGATS